MNIDYLLIPPLILVEIGIDILPKIMQEVINWHPSEALASPLQVFLVACACEHINSFLLLNII
jgi:hypothetical protein